MPKTQAGKIRSRQNSLKHGLRATDELLLSSMTPRDRSIFEKVRRALHKDYNPEFDHEKSLVDRMAVQHFRLQRLYALENKLSRLSSKASLSQLDNLSRYDFRIEKQLRILHNRLHSLYFKRSNYSLTRFNDTK